MADLELLNKAFRNFTNASKSLETYYEHLRDRVRYLTKELEKKNRELNKALFDAEQSKDYLNAILYNLEDAIIVIDPEERITILNRSAERLLGFCLIDVIGRTFKSLNFCITHEGSDTYLNIQGQKYIIIFSRSPVTDSKGGLIGSVILIKDITRIRELEIQHERNQRLVAMGEMAATIVHEIRNPLCSMELFSSMLEKELQDKGHKELARGISICINNLNTILTNMLFFARTHKPAMKTIQLDNVIKESLTLLAPFMESRNIKLNFEIFDCEISGDAELLKQTFMNVIINAIQSMPEGGNVEVKIRIESESLVVDVKDSGEGIKRENIEKIFDPFFSTKDAGTGLGLAIASKIMQAHGGYISVQSEEGKGSTFSLYFRSNGG